jgi:hypothetical protein
MELEPLVPSSLGNAAIWFRGIVPHDRLRPTHPSMARPMKTELTTKVWTGKRGQAKYARLAHSPLGEGHLFEVFNEDRHINFNASHDEAMRLVEGLLSNCPMMKLVGNERLIKFLKKIVDMAERGKSGQ